MIKTTENTDNKEAMKLLQKHFDIALETPDGVKKLRDLILTLAMQGKLVKQDPKDQPASELLREIEAEKKRLVKEGKIKKQEPLPPIKPEEVPYDVLMGVGVGLSYRIICSCYGWRSPTSTTISLRHSIFGDWKFKHR